MHRLVKFALTRLRQRILAPSPSKQEPNSEIGFVSHPPDIHPDLLALSELCASLLAKSSVTPSEQKPNSEIGFVSALHFSKTTEPPSGISPP